VVVISIAAQFDRTGWEEPDKQSVSRVARSNKIKKAKFGNLKLTTYYNYYKFWSDFQKHALRYTSSTNTKKDQINFILAFKRPNGNPES